MAQKPMTADVSALIALQQDIEAETLSKQRYLPPRQSDTIIGPVSDYLRKMYALRLKATRAVTVKKTQIGFEDTDSARDELLHELSALSERVTLLDALILAQLRKELGNAATKTIVLRDTGTNIVGVVTKDARKAFDALRAELYHTIGAFQEEQLGGQHDCEEQKAELKNEFGDLFDEAFGSGMRRRGPPQGLVKAIFEKLKSEGIFPKDARLEDVAMSSM